MGPPQPQEKEQYAVRSSRSQYNGSRGTVAGNDRYTVPAQLAQTGTWALGGTQQPGKQHRHQPSRPLPHTS